MHEPLKNAVERPLFRELFTLSASDATHNDAYDRVRNESRLKSLLAVIIVHHDPFRTKSRSIKQKIT